MKAARRGRRCGQLVASAEGLHARLKVVEEALEPNAGSCTFIVLPTSAESPVATFAEGEGPERGDICIAFEPIQREHGSGQPLLQRRVSSCYSPGVVRVGSALVFLSVLGLCLFGQLRMLQGGDGVPREKPVHKIICRLKPPDDAAPAGPYAKQSPARIPWPAAFRAGRETLPAHQR